MQRSLSILFLTFVFTGCRSETTYNGDKYKKCRLHDTSTVNLCCTSQPSLTFRDVVSATRCAILCSKYDGTKFVLPPYNRYRPMKMFRYVIDPPFGTTMPSPGEPHPSVIYSSFCVSFNYKAPLKTCELFDGRYKYEVVRGYRQCSFLQKVVEPNRPCWISEYEDCDQIPGLTPEDSGIYWISINDYIRSFFCEVSDDKKIFTIFQRRMKGLVNFNRDMAGYAIGFGSFRSEFQIGLMAVSEYTSRDNYTLRIEIKMSDNTTLYADYTDFNIGNSITFFQIRFGTYSGNAGDALSYHRNMSFSTIDIDNDKNSSISCAKLHQSGWWYNNCKQSNLNAPYCNNTKLCANWLDYNLGWKLVQMKVIRNNSRVKTPDPFGPNDD